MTKSLRELLDKDHKEDKEAEEFCRLFKDKNNIPKFIYGINEYAISVAKILEIDGFIDDFREEKEFLGKPVIKLNEAPRDGLVLIAIVGVIPVTVRKRVRNLGLIHCDYFSFCRYSRLDINKKFLFDFDEFREDFFKNIDRYEEIYNLLSDEESKDVFWRLINFRLFYDLSYMEQFRDRRHEQYFEDFLDLKGQEIFVDAGGFDGETTLEFIKRCPSYKAIYFFEPDRENLQIAMERLGSFRDIYFYNIGLYNSTKRVGFKFDKSASMICEEGEKEIDVDRLDNILKGSVTFIKMDIEGAEREALEGAKDLIIRNRPKLAISAYHRFDDFWRIPELVLSISDNYSVYMRHYTEGFTETVIFFQP
jgi:FkbM family methyltransferase